MKVKWLGQASFLITSASGTKIITDPYATNDKLQYGEINETADIVTISHDHFDHNNVAAVKGNPEVVRGTAEAKGIKFKGIPTYHDDVQGGKRGSNTIFCFDVDGIKICHLGDLGHPLTDKQAAEVGKVDVLLIPVGGFFTIDVEVANQIYDQLKPRVTIPMHFKNEKCSFPIDVVDEFLRGKGNVKQSDSSEVEFKAEGLPAESQIIVLRPAL
ncbi:MBL fold metallo-hydrolase [Chloroflexota bacterium]